MCTYLNGIPGVFHCLDMMFGFDVSIHNFVVFRRCFILDGFLIDIFTIRSSSVLITAFDWSSKRRVICTRQRGTLGRYVSATAAACARNADEKKMKK